MGLFLAALASAGTARAQGDLRATGRQLAADLRDAIVTVKVVISVKMSFGGQQSPENETKHEASGTVVAPDGTTVVPLSAIDPSLMYKRMMSQERSQEMTIDSRLKDLKIVVNKKTEIPATVVQRDPDLDLAVIRPVEKPKAPLKAIDLKNIAEPKLLEQVLVLARMGRVADYEIGVMTGEIQSIISKPRKFYIPSAELASGGYGVPIFTVDAKLVGMVLMRVAPGGLGAGDFSPGGDNGGMVAIILPASDVQEIVTQAKPAK
jgi:S1-C subfamily serine protease